MRSLDATYMQSLAFSSSQLSTLTRIGEHRGRQALYSKQSPEALKSLLHVATVESSESSSRMEGVTAPRRRIQALVRGGTAPRNRSEQEIAGYRDALALIHESVPNMPLSSNLLLQLHSLLYRYLPGEGGRWKMTDNAIVERAADGTVHRIRFRPVSAVQTPQAMEDLVSGYAEATERPDAEPLLIVPLTVFDFLCIHPFSDGNGRISRLLTLLLLYRCGYEIGRYISLERIFEETKDTYYETLEASSQGWHEGKHDVLPWVNYFWGVILRACAEFEERIGVVLKGRGAKTLAVQSAILKRRAPFSISDLENECPGVSRDMIRVVLRQMRDAGQIEVRGKGRGAKWVVL